MLRAHSYTVQHCTRWWFASLALHVQAPFFRCLSTEIVANTGAYEINSNRSNLMVYVLYFKIFDPNRFLHSYVDIHTTGSVCTIIYKLGWWITMIHFKFVKFVK